MQLETSENSRGGSVSGSYPHAGGNTTQDECFQFRRFSQREKQFDDFWKNIEKNYTKAKERGGYITAYVPEKRGYVTQYGYIADIQPTFYSVANGKIKYDAIKFSFIGGVYDK